MIYYLLTTDKEAEIFHRLSRKKVPKGQIQVIGEGAEELREFTADDVLVHIGYASGYKVDVGRVVEPVYVVDAWTREVIRTDTIFPVEHRICFTTDRFVDMPVTDYASICDMELFKIMLAKHKRVHALKIVSDNLDEEDRKVFEDEEAWKEAIRLIGEFVRE